MPKIISAIVIKNKMTKTVIVNIDRVVKHPKYHKILKRRTKLFVHNDLGDLPVGTKVSITETKPYSKNTNFKVIKKL